MTRGFIIPLALAAAVIAMPSGCITSEDGPTVIIGEDGMTVLLNGKSVPNPATIEALGEGYSFDNPTLYYNGEVSAGVIFYEGSEQDDELKREIKWLTASQDFTADGALSVNGITLGSEQSEVLEIFGVPQGVEEDADMWFYRGENQPEDQDYLGFSFDENDKVSWIGVWINRSAQESELPQILI